MTAHTFLKRFLFFFLICLSLSCAAECLAAVAPTAPAESASSFWVGKYGITIIVCASLMVLVWIVANVRRNNVIRENAFIYSHIPIRVVAYNKDNYLIFNHSGDAQIQKLLKYGKKNFHLSELPEEIFIPFTQGLKMTRASGRVESVIYHCVDSYRRATFVKLPEKRFGKDAVMIFSVDITDIENANKELQAALDKIRHADAEKSMILDAIDVPVILFDKSFKIININSAGVAAAGDGTLSRERVISEPCYMNFCGGNKPMDGCLFESVMRTKKPHSIEAVSMTGRDIRATSTPVFDAAGEIVNIVESITDLTDIYNSKRELTKAMEAAQAADKAKSLFLATVSHEIRTPLNAVIGYSELSQDKGMAPETIVENLKHINSAANSLLSLINDVLDISRLEAGQMEITKAPVDFHVLMDELTGIFKFRADRQNIGLSCEFAGAVPVLMLDPLRIKQVLMNIVGNAVKFTDHGEVRVEVSFMPSGENRGALQIKVSDTGMGIAPGYTQKIFDPFERQPEGMARGLRAREGTGLGLSISQRLIGQMGGAITVESELGKGSTFTVSVPVVEIFKGKIEKPSAPAPVPASVFNPAESKVLIVDDISTNLKVLEAMLKKIGVQVMASSSGAEALERAKAEPPTIVLTDLWMPEMDGEAFARKLREIPAYAHLPIIAVTADSQIKNDDRIFDDILLKPITLEKVRTILEKFATSGRAVSLKS